MLQPHHCFDKPGRNIPTIIELLALLERSPDFRYPFGYPVLLSLQESQSIYISNPFLASRIYHHARVCEKHNAGYRWGGASLLAITPCRRNRNNKDYISAIDAHHHLSLSRFLSRQIISPPCSQDSGEEADIQGQQNGNNAVLSAKTNQPRLIPRLSRTYFHRDPPKTCQNKGMSL